MRKCDPVSDGQTDRRDHRAEGLETTAVAKAAGYSETQLSAMLHGRKVIRDVEVLAIAKALDVPVGELFEGNEK